MIFEKHTIISLVFEHFSELVTNYAIVDERCVLQSQGIWVLILYPSN